MESSPPLSTIESISSTETEAPVYTTMESSIIARYSLPRGRNDEIRSRMQYDLTAAQNGVQLPEHIVNYMVKTGKIDLFINILLAAPPESHGNNEGGNEDTAESEDDDSESDCEEITIKRRKLDTQSVATQTSLTTIRACMQQFSKKHSEN